MSDTTGARRFSFRLPDSFSALRHRDFRLFWIGAFVSFVGSWIQATGQQWLVYDMTGSKQALGLVTFIGAAPMFFLSPLGGWLADRCNKRTVLVTAQITFALSAFLIAASVWLHFVSFALVSAVAFVNGCTSVIEIPTRQSMVSNIVPAEDLANALPLSSTTFNAARILGPAIGGLLLGYFGAAACYFVNGISFAAIVFAIVAISADLRSTADRSASLKDALLEGIRHVARTPAFRTLVLMMMTTAIFGLFYLAVLSAFAKSVLHVGAQGFGGMLTATGVGAVVGLVLIAILSSKRVRGTVPIFSMIGFGGCLLGMSFAAHFWQAGLCLGGIGFFGVGQMVGTNTALQYFSPPDLRGRIISVYVWSLAGLNPVGALLFGILSERLGLPFAFRLGGAVVLVVGLLVLLFGKSLKALA